jgi:hypothetical protein
MSKTISRRVAPIGTSISPEWLTAPVSEKTLVPLLFSVPIDANQRFHVVDQGGVFPQARLRRIRRPRAGLPAPSLDRGDQGCFFATNERPRAQADVDVEIELRPANAVAQQAHLLGLPNRRFQPLDRQGIFRAHVDESLARADRVSRHRHAFKNAMWIAFQDAAVHVGSGIPLVAIADDVFLIGDRLGHRSPFQAGRVTRAAAPAQSAVGDDLDDFFGRHLVDHVDQRLVSTVRDVIFDPLRIDRPAVLEGDLHLLFKKRDVRGPCQPLHGPVSQAVHDRRRILRLDLAIQQVGFGQLQRRSYRA